MEELANVYQYLRGSAVIPFFIALIFFAPLVIQRQTKGRMERSLYTWFGITGIAWVLFAAFNFIFPQTPFVALPDIIYVGIPLLVCTINSLLFWVSSFFNTGINNQNAL